MMKGMRSSIMHLVGDAAKKLDFYIHELHGSERVKDFKEYKELHKLYDTRTDVIGRGALFRSKDEKKEGSGSAVKKHSKKTECLTETKKIFVNLENVKKDTEYELFFIRKEDGTRFFSPSILRNLKLVCDFESYLHPVENKNPLENLKEWEDRVICQNAKELLGYIRPSLELFFRTTRKAREQDLVNLLTKCLMALMLSSQSTNALSYDPVKSCGHYFRDFQNYFRQALQSETYQVLLKYPSQSQNTYAFQLVEMLHVLCRGIYTQMHGIKEMTKHVRKLVADALSLKAEQTPLAATKKVWNQVTKEYEAMAQLLKGYTHAPLLKVMEMLEKSTFHMFAPLLQGNLPAALFQFDVGNQTCELLKLPSPTYQEFINRVAVDEEFKGFIQGQTQPNRQGHHVLLNLQDRTSWRDYARCVALENLPEQPELQAGLTVYTLASCTDFYHQSGVYEEENHADVFKKQLKETVLDTHSGFFFPASLDRKALTHFIDQACDKIHRLFFSSKNVLMKTSRLAFIDLFYLLLGLKAIEWTHATSLSFTSKDYVDRGAAYSALLLSLLKFSDPKGDLKGWHDEFNAMVYGSVLTVRERLMHPEQFQRMTETLKVIENARYELGKEPFAQQMQQVLQELFQQLVKI